CRPRRTVGWARWRLPCYAVRGGPGGGLGLGSDLGLCTWHRGLGAGLAPCARRCGLGAGLALCARRYDLGVDLVFFAACRRPGGCALAWLTFAGRRGHCRILAWPPWSAVARAVT